MKLRTLLLTFVLIAFVGQDSAWPANAPLQAPSQQAHQQPSQTGPIAAPERKITPQEAKELFRSVDDILQFVSKDTGFPIKHAVKRQLADRQQVWRFIEDRMNTDEDAKRLARSEVVLKKFGLVPRDFDLHSFLLELLKEQVAGFYDAKTKTVYLLDWVEPEQQKPVLAHELTHALQDQNFGLQEMTKAASKSDAARLQSDERLAALQAITEGQAMIVLLDYSLAPADSSVAQQPNLVDAVGAALTPAGPGMAVFNRAPMFLQQVLLFPYRYGAAFTRDLLVAGGKHKAFTEILKHPPQDTRQILEPQTYLRGEFVPPLKPLDFPKLAQDYKQWDQSVIGQFDLVLLLNQYSPAAAEKKLSSEWRGGYYWAALTPQAVKDKTETPATSDIALAYISRWASADAAQQFAATYSQAVSKRYAGAHTTTGGTSPDSKKNVPGTGLRDVPGTGIQVALTPRLSSPVTWQTGEGLVSIEARGDRVLVTESFDPTTAARIRDAVFGEGTPTRETQRH